MRWLRLLVVPAMLVGNVTLGAQSPLGSGIEAMGRHALPTARARFQEVLASDPTNYEANWRLAHVLLDLGKVTPDEVASAERDSLYAAAERYARQAVAANPDGADGHFVLANALGRVSLTRSKRERVELAVVIRNEALRALGLDPEHAGAYHVLGRWHAEIMRLSSIERFFAKQFLGADIFKLASWDHAVRYLQLAIRHDPNRIFHHLDLGLVYLDRERWAEATAAFQAVLALPVAEPMDVHYQAEARDALRRIGVQKGGS